VISVDALRLTRWPHAEIMPFSGYFPTLCDRPDRGRDFSDRITKNFARVAVITQAMANSTAGSGSAGQSFAVTANDASRDHL